MTCDISCGHTLLVLPPSHTLSVSLFLSFFLSVLCVFTLHINRFVDMFSMCRLIDPWNVWNSALYSSVCILEVVNKNETKRLKLMRFTVAQKRQRCRRRRCRFMHTSPYIRRCCFSPPSLLSLSLALILVSAIGSSKSLTHSLHSPCSRVCVCAQCMCVFEMPCSYRYNN